MTIQKLHAGWSMCIQGQEEILPAQVPGSVYNDLLVNHKMEDPYYRDNELKSLAIMEHDFVYRTEFLVPQDILDSQEVILRMEGIDTLGEVWLNDTFLGTVKNMHRIWEFSVKNYLKKEANELKVILFSPTRFVREANEARPIGGSEDAMQGFPYLRKAHCMFGWDWGPRLPDAGIFRDVLLLGYDTARIDSVYISQDHRNDCVGLTFDMDVIRSGAGSSVKFVNGGEELKGLNMRIIITDPLGTVIADEVDPEKICINNPQLWWPNGYGSQPLYEVEAMLYDQEKLLDTWKRKIGLRTQTMHREKDEFGEQFAHMVNGVKIFAMGSDYIPEDNILSRITKERTYHLLEQAKAAHFNCIRVWGGGHYPNDSFFDACDELGLLVWEDFMFACAVYQLTEEFEENITAEFIDNIKRIRHHASLALWCGNNEMEQFVLEGCWVNRPEERSDYIKMYEYILPKVLKKYDPQTFYWPASPSSGGAFDVPNDENRGDVHYWAVWHGNKPITEYRKFYFRYVSEFGFQSFPSLKTCETFTKPEDRNIFSYVMEKHQRNQTANGKIMGYMEQTFLYPTSFDIILYASQLLQAEAMRYGVEHFRRNRGRCMGTVIWQLNDCWPVASWSSIDYYGRWKALHYYAKRFFAPVMISCEEEGILTQDTNPNAEPYEVKKSIRLCVANETMQEKKVCVKWALRNSKADVIRGGQENVVLAPLSSTWLTKEDCMDASLYTDYVSYECLEEECVVSSGTVLFCAPKYFQFQDPCLSVRAEGDELVVTSQAYARSVEIINEDDTMLLEDNYFDMNAGERRIKVIKGNPAGLKIRSVYQIR